MEIKVDLHSGALVPVALVNTYALARVNRIATVRQVVGRIGKNHIYACLRQTSQHLEAVPQIDDGVANGLVRLGAEGRLFV